ncbi:MAG: hypothetical protein E7588_00420 [Ruminococcaceae bacterium]|nr:hypothetical protein [Oscillospiraceae bacterium]
MTDYNCFVGEWPFHKLSEYTFEHLKTVHSEYGITDGYVSSVKSVFYNDVYDSEKELYETLQGTQYKQVTVANPTLPGSLLTLERCINEFDIKGIRLIPGYHGYNINSDIADKAADIAEKYGLILFITDRMMDERITHMILPPLIEHNDIVAFVKRHLELRVVLNCFKLGEAVAIEKELKEYPNVLFESCGFGVNALAGREEADPLFERTVFGSGFPIICTASSAIYFNKEIKKL